MLSDKELIEQLKIRLAKSAEMAVMLAKQGEELQSVNEKLSESEALKSHLYQTLPMRL